MWIEPLTQFLLTGSALVLRTNFPVIQSDSSTDPIQACNLNSGAIHLMPAKRLRLRWRCIFTLIAAVLVLGVTVEAQTGRVSLQGAVSETVALSVLPNFTHGKVDAEVVSSGNTLRLTLISLDAEPPVIHVPLLVRSNSGFRLSAVFESTTAVLAQLSVTDVHATGKLSSSQAVNAVRLMPRFDLRGLNESVAALPLDTSQPLLVLSGPRVSLGGTLTSPNNALQVTLLIRLQPQTARARGWIVHLT